MHGTKEKGQRKRRKQKSKFLTKWMELFLGPSVQAHSGAEVTGGGLRLESDMTGTSTRAIGWKRGPASLVSKPIAKRSQSFYLATFQFESTESDQNCRSPIGLWRFPKMGSEGTVCTGKPST